jgi:hypothetical protein
MMVLVGGTGGSSATNFCSSHGHCTTFQALLNAFGYVTTHNCLTICVNRKQALIHFVNILPFVGGMKELLLLQGG